MAHPNKLGTHAAPVLKKSIAGISSRTAVGQALGRVKTIDNFVWQPLFAVKHKLKAPVMSVVNGYVPKH